MSPELSQPQPGKLFHPRLDEQLHMKYPLVKLVGLIDWAHIQRAFAVPFISGLSRLALTARLVAVYKHTFEVSDEAWVHTWVENLYWQLFCGETYLQTELPIDPSSRTRWRKRISEEAVEILLAASIEAVRRGGGVHKSSARLVIMDTTVMPKAIALPTNSWLLGKSPQHLAKAAENNGRRLRQNYNRVAPRLGT